MLWRMLTCLREPCSRRSIRRLAAGLKINWVPCRDLLISEYIGEVIGHSNFLRRIRDYGEEGIKHFYFMALQRDEVSVSLLVSTSLHVHSLR